MKWFDNWFENKCRKALRDSENTTGTVLSVCEPDHHALHDGISIHLKQVIGGRLVTFHVYERKTDQNHTRTYVITDDQDFERELGKIITMESLRLHDR